jgi:exosortase O
MIKKLPIPANKYLDLVILLAIASAWFLTNISALAWLYDSILQTSWFNKILIGGLVVGLAVWTLIKQPLPVLKPAIRSQPLILVVVSAIAGLIWQWTFELPQITTVFFLFGSYGLFGIFWQSHNWNKRLAIALIISLILPFSLQFTSGLGLAARIVTAHLVEKILTFAHLAAISSYDVLILENGIAHVDLPCSGLRSLWTGSVFLLGITWLENRKLGWKWLLVYGSCLLLLLNANVGRVLVLTYVTFVLKQPLLADLIHLPLGIVGFIGACGITWLGLRFVPKNIDSIPLAKLKNPDLIPFAANSSNLSRNQLAYRLPLFALLVFILVLGLIPRPNLAIENLTTTIQLPASIQTQSLPLTSQEQELFGDSAAERIPLGIATKQKFEFGNLSGSMLLVSSNSWRSHHAPELCFVGNGFKIDNMGSSQLTAGFPVRWLNLEQGKMSAIYWFQSPSQITDQLLNRIWGEISSHDRNWMMVSILFDQKQAIDNAEVIAFSNSIRAALFPQTSHSTNSSLPISKA